MGTFLRHTVEVMTMEMNDDDDDDDARLRLDPLWKLTVLHKLVSLIYGVRRRGSEGVLGKVKRRDGKVGWVKKKGGKGMKRM